MAAKFKAGDKVIQVKNYSYYPNVGLTGTIMFTYEEPEQEVRYVVDWDKFGMDMDDETFEGELKLLTKLERALK